MEVVWVVGVIDKVEIEMRGCVGVDDDEIGVGSDGLIIISS
jgi:hypothetical protein